MTDYLCYFEIHVDDRTFREHVVVTAESVEQAIEFLEANSDRGEHYHKQAKGVLGELSLDLVKTFLQLKGRGINFFVSGSSEGSYNPRGLKRLKVTR